MSAHSIDGVEQDVTKFARAVALKRATVTAVVTGALAFAVGKHWITPDWSKTLTDGVQDGLGLAGVIGAGAWIHKGTTPADQSLQPVNSDGQALVPDPAAVEAFDADQTPDPDLTTAFEADPTPTETAS